MKNVSLEVEYDKDTKLMPEPPCTHRGGYCPTLYMSFSDNRLDGIPEDGEITFKFRRVSKTESERDGKESTSVELELPKIVAVKPGSGKKISEAADALDVLKAALEKGE